jgi:hypothetical protein
VKIEINDEEVEGKAGRKERMLKMVMKSPT